MQANSLPFYTSMTPGWGQKVKTIFFLKKVMMLHIKLKGSIKHYASKCLTLCTPLTLWARHWNCADMYILIELCELIGFGYDHRDTKEAHIG